MTYTPGPWVQPHGSDVCVCAGDNPTRPGRILFVLRHPLGTTDHLPDEELAANTTLVVAAPDMLNALIRAKVMLQIVKDDGMFECANTLAQVKEAIAKAEGAL